MTQNKHFIFAGAGLFLAGALVGGLVTVLLVPGPETQDAKRGAPTGIGASAPASTVSVLGNDPAPGTGPAMNHFSRTSADNPDPQSPQQEPPLPPRQALEKRLLEKWRKGETYTNFLSRNRWKGEMELTEEFKELFDLSDYEFDQANLAVQTANEHFLALQQENSEYLENHEPKSDPDGEVIGSVRVNRFSEEGQLLRESLMGDLASTIGVEKAGLLEEYFADQIDNSFQKFGRRGLIFTLSEHEDPEYVDVTVERLADPDDELSATGWSRGSFEVEDALRPPLDHYFDITNFGNTPKK